MVTILMSVSLAVIAIVTVMEQSHQGATLIGIQPGSGGLESLQRLGQLFLLHQTEARSPRVHLLLLRL